MPSFNVFKSSVAFLRVYTVYMNSAISVTLQALHGYYIGGFFIQARVARNCHTEEQKKSVGVFELLRGEQYLKTISCNNRLNVSQEKRQ